MQRLREVTQGASEAEQHAAQLLRSVGPLEVSQLAQLRVRRELRQRGRLGRFSLPMAVAVGILTLGATAAALWGGAQLLKRAPETHENAQSGAAIAPSAARTHLAAASQKQADPVAGDDAAGAAQGIPPKTNEPSKTKSEARVLSRQALASKARSTTAQSRSDAELVQQAVEALRAKGDAARALRLLDQYRSQGGSALAEEALALSIEAALRSSPARARHFADEYLRKYESGRFRALAERARADTSSAAENRKN